MLNKQCTLLPENQTPVLAEIALTEAQSLTDQIKAEVEAQSEMIEVAGSIRRQKTEVHDIDFVALAKNDAEW